MERSRFITIALVALSITTVAHAQSVVAFEIYAIFTFAFVVSFSHSIAIYCSNKPRLQPISPLISFIFLIFTLLIANADGNFANAIPSIDSIVAIIDNAREGVIQLRTTGFPVTYSTEIFLVVIILSWVLAEVGETLAQRLHTSAPTLLWYVCVNAGLAAHDSSGSIAIVATAICASSIFFLYAFEIGTESAKSHVIAIPRISKITNLVTYLTAFSLLIGLSLIAILPLELPSYAPKNVLKFLNGGRAQTELSPLVGMTAKLKDEETQVLFRASANEVQYWRVRVLDNFDGKTWSVNSEEKQKPELITQGIPTRPLEASIQLDNLAATFLPGLYSTQSTSSSDIKFLESGVLFTNNSKLKNYSILALAPPQDLDATQIEASSEPAPSSVDSSTLLPTDFDKDIIKLSQSLVRDKSSIHEQAISLRDFFLDGSFVYDLDVDFSSSTNAMQEFIQTRRGFCEQFATTYAAMARSVGIPARVIIGFSPGELDSNGQFTVTNRQAHSWVEVYLSNFGWLTVDPTPPGPLPGQAPENIGAIVTTTTTTTVPNSSSVSIPQESTVVTQPEDKPIVKSEADSKTPFVVISILFLFLTAGGIVLYQKRRKIGRNNEAYIIATFKEISEKVLQVPPTPSLTISELADRVPDGQRSIKEFLALLTLASYAPEGNLLLGEVKTAAIKARSDLSKGHADRAMMLKD